VTRPRAQAWKPTVSGSTRQRSLSGSVEGYVFTAGTATNSVMAPSRCTPKVSLSRQAFSRPRRQEGHLPQLVYGETVTCVPAPSVAFPSSTVAAISCPSTRG
jgi:hypothetical protein